MSRILVMILFLLISFLLMKEISSTIGDEYNKDSVNMISVPIALNGINSGVSFNGYAFDIGM